MRTLLCICAAILVVNVSTASSVIFLENKVLKVEIGADGSLIGLTDLLNKQVTYICLSWLLIISHMFV